MRFRFRKFFRARDLRKKSNIIAQNNIVANLCQMRDKVKRFVWRSVLAYF